RSLADLLSHVRRQSRLFRLSHQSQLLLDLPVRNQAEERRLLKLHGQSLAQRVVKHSVTCLVIEIREDNRVLVGECWRAVNVEVTCDGKRQRSRSGARRQL